MAMTGLPLTLVSDEQVLAYERAHLRDGHPRIGTRVGPADGTSSSSPKARRRRAALAHLPTRRVTATRLPRR